MVIRNFIDSPEPDVESNPIVIGGDLAPLGSASNPIVIHVDENCGHYATALSGSDVETEIMATPEFWENLIDKSFREPTNEGAAIDRPPVRAPTRSPAYEDPEDLQPFGQSPPKCFHMDDKTLLYRVGEIHAEAG